MGRGERVKGNCIGYQIMTEKAILSSSPKLPSDLKGHKIHPKKPLLRKAKQSLHLSPACSSCVAAPPSTLCTDTQQLSPEGQELHLETETDAFPHTGTQALVTIKHTAIMAGSALMSSVTALDTQHHEGSYRVISGPSWGEFMLITPAGTGHGTLLSILLGDATFIAKVSSASCFQNCSGFLLFSHSHSDYFNCINPAFHLLLLMDIGAGEMQVEHHKSKRQVSFEGKGI